MTTRTRVRRRAARAWALAAAVVLGAAVTAAAPVGTPAQAEEAQPETLSVAQLQSIDSLNPFLAYFSSSADLFRVTYPFLTTYSAKDLTPVPALAESWKASDDKLTWTYTIRKGLEWSDGEPITAADPAFTFNLMMTDEAAATANGNFVENFAKVEAPDARTLVITTKKPQATMLALDVPIVPEHIWSKVDDIGEYANDTMPMVGYGPFTLTDFKTDEYLKLESNKDFFRGAPHFDGLVFRFYKNSDAAVAALRKGEVDMAFAMTAAQFDAIKGAEGITTNHATGTRFYQMQMNPGAATAAGKPIGDGDPVLTDVRVRRAIAHAIDKDTLVEKALGGLAQVGAGYIPAAFGTYHWEPSADEAYGYDPAKANAMLDEAGYAKGPDGVRRDPKTKKPLSFRLLAHADRAEDPILAQYIQGWLRKVGIGVKVQTVSSTRLNDLISGGDYDMALGGWNGNPDPDFLLSIQTCGNRPDANGEGGLTDNFFCNADFDRLYAAQQAEFDQAERVRIVKQMQGILHEQASSVVLYYADRLEAWRGDHVTDLTKQPVDGGAVLGQDGPWAYLSAKPVASAESESSGSAVAAGVAAGVAVLSGLGVVLARRRKATEDERA